jgi:ribonucleoside-triphosphate reductase
MNTKRCEVEVFSRVTGFFRPVQSWNKGKTEEFKDRKKYNMDGVTEKNEASRATKAFVG